MLQHLRGFPGKCRTFVEFHACPSPRLGLHPLQGARARALPESPSENPRSPKATQQRMQGRRSSRACDIVPHMALLHRPSSDLHACKVDMGAQHRTQARTKLLDTKTRNLCVCRMDCPVANSPTTLQRRGLATLHDAKLRRAERRRRHQATHTTSGSDADAQRGQAFAGATHAQHIRGKHGLVNTWPSKRKKLLLRRCGLHGSSVACVLYCAHLSIE